MPRPTAEPVKKRARSEDEEEEDRGDSELAQEAKRLKQEHEEDLEGLSSPVQTEHQDYPDESLYTPEYLSLLQSIQESIRNPMDSDKLEIIISTIQKTGCFAVRDGSFDFDLCRLDRRTVKKIQRVLDIKE